MDLNLRSKVYIITGGAKGIGGAIVTSLANEGAIPVIVDKYVDENTTVVKELREQNKDIHFIQQELGTDDVCQGVVDEVIGKYGKLDGIVNNAGINDSVGLEKGSPQRFIKSVLSNLTHSYDLVHYALEHLKKSQGSIVNISSKVAITGQGNTSGYAASKGALLALTREWAVELAPFNIRVNAILPAEVMTPLYEKWLSTFDDPESKLKSITAKIPLAQRMTTAQEIADTAVFILSDRSGHTTGQWLSIDGGYVHLDRSIS